MHKVRRDNENLPAWEIEGKAVVSVTHPTQPVHSGNARGRKIHLAKDETLSMCNMLIDEIMTVFPDGTPWSCLADRKCKICFPQM